jgi:hypothetical protein
LNEGDKELNFSDYNRLLGGLARELKLSLTFIARQAEYLAEKDSSKLKGIEKSAANSLKLIDNYLLTARSEYGQQLLPLEPIGPGSILYEVCQELSPAHVTAQADYSAPIMGHKRALVVSLYSIAQVVAGSAKDIKKELFVVAQKRSKGELCMGVFAEDFLIKPTEIRRSAEMMGSSNMPLSNQTFKSGVDLTIAGQLASSMGGNLFTTKYKGRGGIAISLIKSNQLSLVS